MQQYPQYEGAGTELPHLTLPVSHKPSLDPLCSRTAPAKVTIDLCVAESSEQCSVVI